MSNAEMGRSRRSPPPSSGRFLHKDVATELRRRIQSGAYPEGSRIPSREQLSKEFSVSTITIRRAIHGLSIEGLLSGRQGLGVFVNHRKRVVRSLTTARIADDIRKAGLEPSVEHLSLRLTHADREIESQLAVATGSLVYRVEKLILASGEPIILDTSFLSQPIGDAVRDGVTGDFLLDLLPKHGFALGKRLIQVEAGTTGEREAQLLRLAVSAPLLIARYVWLSTKGEPLFAGWSASRGDRLVYRFSAPPFPTDEQESSTRRHRSRR